MIKDANNKRRDFLRQTGTVLGIGLMLPVLPAFISSCSSSTPTGPSEITINISDYAGLSVDGTAVYVSKNGFNSGKPVIVTRVSSGVFRVLSAKCTHEGETVGLPTGSTMRCPSHGAVFSTVDGIVISGPANSPLQKFTGTFDTVNNTLIIST